MMSLLTDNKWKGWKSPVILEFILYFVVVQMIYIFYIARCPVMLIVEKHGVI